MGQVKTGGSKGSKTHSLYSTDSYVVSLAVRYIHSQLGIYTVRYIYTQPVRYIHSQLDIYTAS